MTQEDGERRYIVTSSCAFVSSTREENKVNVTLSSMLFRSVSSFLSAVQSTRGSYTNASSRVSRVSLLLKVLKLSEHYRVSSLKNAIVTFA